MRRYDESSRTLAIQLLKNALHGATGLVGVRISRTGYGMLGWLTTRSELLGRVLGHPYVFVPDEKHRHQWLKQLGIRTVLDVGAHEGDFAQRIHDMLPDAAIVSFEPLPECFRALEKVSATLPKHRCFNVAVGSAPGEAEMGQNEYTQASSLLPTNDEMRKLMPFAAETRPVKVRVDTLDRLCSELQLEDNLMVKIDVQGFEREVIAGGRDTLRRAKLVLIETSFQRIYQGQPLFEAVYRDLVDELGFRYRGSFSRQESPVDGAPLQEDSLFIRE